MDDNFVHPGQGVVIDCNRCTAESIGLMQLESRDKSCNRPRLHAV